MSNLPPDGRKPPDEEMEPQAQPEAAAGREISRGMSGMLSELSSPLIRILSSATSNGMGLVDDDQVSALSDGFPEWANLSRGEVQPSNTETISAPDLDAFYEANFNRICRKLAVVFRQDISYAEDITQEAFVIAYRYWPGISQMANPYGYVAKIAWRLAMKWMESRRHQWQACADLAAILVPENLGSELDMRIDLARALDRLPEQQRIVAGLSLLGYRPREIAAILEIPLATARTRLKRARDRLLQLLAESEEGPRA